MTAKRASRKPPRNKKRPSWITARLRFRPSAAAELTAAEIVFGAAMQRYRAGRRSPGQTPGEILDVLLSLGYEPPAGDFRAWVADFTGSLAVLKRERRRSLATWGEVLGAAAALGWVKPKEPAIISVVCFTGNIFPIESAVPHETPEPDRDPDLRVGA